MSSLREDEAELKIEILHRDHAALRNLETWGSSLLLGANALIIKQLAEWDLALSPPMVQLPAWACTIPFLVGLFGLLVLRAVSFHLFRTSARLWSLVGEKLRPAHRLNGLLGKLLAAAQPALGFLGMLFLLRDFGDHVRVAWAASTAVLLAPAVWCVSRMGARARRFPRDARLSVAVVPAPPKGD
jgi:hypothetical protein